MIDSCEEVEGGRTINRKTYGHETKTVIYGKLMKKTKGKITQTIIHISELSENEKRSREWRT